MPIFDYQCEACGHHFDILQKAGEGALRKCPECGKLKLRKLLSAPSFHLKGGGWYKSPPSEGKAKGDGKSEATPKKGHNLDGDKSHSHDHGHSHGPGGHTHSHGEGGHKH
jgi:putative FmdB family regulatory protein